MLCSATATERWWHRPGRVPLSATTQAYLRSDSSPHQHSIFLLLLFCYPIFNPFYFGPLGFNPLPDSMRTPSVLNQDGFLSLWPKQGFYFRPTRMLVCDFVQIQLPICFTLCTNTTPKLPNADIWSWNTDCRKTKSFRKILTCLDKAVSLNIFS